VAQRKIYLLALFLVGMALLSLPLREVKHSSALSRAFGQMAQQARDQSWEEAAAQLITVRRELAALPSAPLYSHWRSEQQALLQQKILTPLELAIQQRSTTKAQTLIAELSVHCTQCHTQSGRSDLPIRKRPTASNVIGE
jgi:hypothetical protein